MRILIPRPQPFADQTALKLRIMGNDPIVFPMSECITLVNPIAAKSFSGLIVTSRNALRGLRDHPQCGAFLHLPLFAVGPKTAEAAQEIGFEHVTFSRLGGAELADHIQDYIKAHDMIVSQATPLLYLAGEPRRFDLEDRLKAHNIFHHVHVIYKMIDMAHNAELPKIILQQVPDIVLFYSKEAVRRFFAACDGKVAKELLQNICYICLSSDIGQSVPKQYCDRLKFASKPDEHHILACVEAYRAS